MLLYGQITPEFPKGPYTLKKIWPCSSTPQHLKVALYSYFSLSFMFSSRQVFSSTVGPIGTKIGMVKAPPHGQGHCLPMYWTARILDTN